MKILLLLIALAMSQAGFAQDKKGCEGSEPSYINRMPGFYISECHNSEYNEKEFIYYAKKGTAFKIKKGGKYYNIWYRKRADETRKFSSAQVILNYYNAILKIKGAALSDDKSMLTGSINGKEVYLQLHTGNSSDIGSYHIDLLEVEEMQQDVVINLDEAIDRDGKAVLYGILFDVGKSDIKPESNAALKQITDYLNANPAVKIIVVGHTDNTGTYANNMTLSKARAESIKNHLITTGKIAGSRLISEGVGQVCPVSTNSTEEGKKLNRRVEIVKQ
ncbi:MAG: OmpA family protein [Chlorobiales bacterium]|jgi:OmpA-OmpF porin, OOP family|nr:OmpA family protein [Chlorobiales bacterium]